MPEAVAAPELPPDFCYTSTSHGAGERSFGYSGPSMVHMSCEGTFTRLQALGAGYSSPERAAAWAWVDHFRLQQILDASACAAPPED